MSNWKAIDCACDTRPYLAAIKAAGVTHVIRYFGSARWKCATRAECDALRAAGLRIVAVYETTARMTLDGFAAGVDGAQRAQAGVAACGGPEHGLIYFACDTDVGPQGIATTLLYLDGAASVLGRYQVGVYGEHDLCAAALAGGHVERAWQCFAWSRGRRLATASLYQRSGRPWGRIVDARGRELDYDGDDVLTADGAVGEWA